MAMIKTYLRDHHAGSAAGVDLFRRVAKSHGDPEVRQAVARIGDDVVSDQRDLERLMRTFGARPAKLKDLIGKVGEKLARLKLNRRLFQRSPLSDVLELEMLVIAVHGKSLGWNLLRQIDDPRLNKEKLDRLFDRARAQEDALEQLRQSQVAKLHWQ